jgi:hypothetical protein
MAASTGSAIGVTSGDGRSRRSTRKAKPFGVALLEQLDEALADPHRRLARLLARLPRQGGRIEQEDRIDVEE